MRLDYKVTQNFSMLSRFRTYLSLFLRIKFWLCLSYLYRASIYIRRYATFEYSTIYNSLHSSPYLCNILALDMRNLHGLLRLREHIIQRVEQRRVVGFRHGNMLYRVVIEGYVVHTMFLS